MLFKGHCDPPGGGLKHRCSRDKPPMTPTQFLGESWTSCTPKNRFGCLGPPRVPPKRFFLGGRGCPHIPPKDALGGLPCPANIFLEVRDPPILPKNDFGGIRDPPSLKTVFGVQDPPHTRQKLSAFHLGHQVCPESIFEVRPPLYRKVQNLKLNLKSKTETEAS